jgi:hypothetical protein
MRRTIVLHDCRSGFTAIGLRGKIAVKPLLQNRYGTLSGVSLDVAFFG